MVAGRHLECAGVGDRNGLVALATFVTGAALGVVQAPGGVVRVIIGLFSLLFGLFPIAAGIHKLTPKVRKQRGYSIKYGLLIIATGILIGGALLGTAISYDPHYCEHNPVQCKQNDLDGDWRLERTVVIRLV